MTYPSHDAGMRRQPARLLTLVGLLLVSCGRERSSIAINLYATALRALRDSIAVYDSTPSILVQAEPVLVKEGAGMSAPADSPSSSSPDGSMASSSSWTPLRAGRFAPRQQARVLRVGQLTCSLCLDPPWSTPQAASLSGPPTRGSTRTQASSGATTRSRFTARRTGGELTQRCSSAPNREHRWSQARHAEV